MEAQSATRASQESILLLYETREASNTKNGRSCKGSPVFFFSLYQLFSDTWNFPVAMCDEVLLWIVVHVDEIVAYFAEFA